MLNLTHEPCPPAESAGRESLENREKNLVTATFYVRYGRALGTAYRTRPARGPATTGDLPTLPW